jgi:heat shock protein HslJ
VRRPWAIIAVAVGVIVIVVGLLGIAGVFNGSSSKASLQSTMVGPTWSLVSITSDGTAWQAPPGATFELTFTDTTYSGNDGCNSVNGEVTFQTTTVTLAPGASTRKACTDPDSARMTDAFHAITAGPVGAVVSGSTLTLTAGQTVLALTKS